MKLSYFKHSESYHLIPAFKVIYEPMKNVSYLTFELTFLNITGYFEIKWKTNL